MKIAAAIARYLLGLIFLVFGSNTFLNFIPQPPAPPGAAGEFSGLLLSTHYMYAVGAVMVASAILFLVNRFAAGAGAGQHPVVPHPDDAEHDRAGRVCYAAVAAGGLPCPWGV